MKNKIAKSVNLTVNAANQESAINVWLDLKERKMEVALFVRIRTQKMRKVFVNLAQANVFVVSQIVVINALLDISLMIVDFVICVLMAMGIITMIMHYANHAHH